MERLIGDIIATAVGRDPNATAATLGDAEVSFGELDAWADRLAGQLGVGPGEIVAWWSGPSLASLAGVLACARAGAVFAPLAPQLSAEEVAETLVAIDARLLVCDAGRPAGALRTRIGASIAVAPIGPGVGAGIGAAPGASPAPLTTSGVDEDDAHILYLTSGSTGRSKGVLVSHRASWLRSSPEGDSATAWPDGVLCTFPLHHYGGWHYVLEAWLRDTAVHLVTHARGEEIIAVVQRRRPTAMYCIPAVWERVLATPGDLSCVRVADTGTSAVAGTLLARLAARVPRAQTRILYGATEAGRMTALAPAELADRPGSVGRPVGAGRIRIADDGEIQFAGPTLMNGYHGLAELTAETVRDGWYRTGDLGHLDDDGYLQITGRVRELIRTGGEWVSPSEVESALGSLPGVDDLGVVGLPDERWGEVVCAAVVPSDGATAPTPRELRARLPGLATFKHPRQVVVVSGIPRTSATGQVMRPALRALVRREHPSTPRSTAERAS